VNFEERGQAKQGREVEGGTGQSVLQRERELYGKKALASVSLTRGKTKAPPLRTGQMPGPIIRVSVFLQIACVSNGPREGEEV